MPVDKWGIPYFYADALHAGISGAGTRFYWTQNNDIHKDDDYEGTAMVRIGKEHDSSDFKVINSTTGEFQFPFNFDSGDGLSLSGPTGHHTGGETHGCQGFTYMINVTLDETPPHFRFRKETYHVQYDNDPINGLWTHPNAPDKIVGGGWYGYGWVRYNKPGGRTPAEIDPDTGQIVTAAKDSVVCECWWNNDPVGDIANWKMLKRVEDKGAGINNWGVPATCDGQAYQVGTWSNIQFRFKVDASDFSLHPLIPEPDNGPNINSIGGESMSFADSEARGYGKRADMPRDVEMKCLFKMDDTSGKCSFKNISLREIDPTLLFDEDPTVPPPDPGGGGGGGTTTLIGTLKFQQDINTYRSSACAGAGTGGGGGGVGGVGNTIFYDALPDHDKELSNTSTFDKRTRVVEIAKNSSSIMVGKKLVQLDVYLDKVGSPAATPTVKAKIWNSSGAVVYTSPTEVDPSGLTSSPTFTKKTFVFTANTHVFVVGDRVGVEYITNSDTDYVECAYEDASSTNTIYANFEDGSYDEKDTRDFACDMWE